MVAVEHPRNGLELHKELSREVHIRPSLRVCGRRRPSFSQRMVLGDECLESQIEGVEALGGVRHEARLPPAADTELFNFARGLPIRKGPIETLRRLRKAFRAAHAKSTAAMKSGDYRALGEAIDAERTLVDQQKSLVDAHMRGARQKR